VPVKRLLPALLCLICLPEPLLAARPLVPEDWYRFQTVSDVRVAPDGGAVLYLVTSYQREADESRGALWLASWAGGDTVQLTRTGSASEPRFSPDGRYVSYLAAADADGKTELWLLDRRGGEPRQLTHAAGELGGYEWSPDGTHIVLVMHGEREREAKPPKPIVIDAFHFKQDGTGYLSASASTHLYLLEVGSGSCQALTETSGRSETNPAFSPDGRELAYVSDPLAGPRNTATHDLMLIAAHPGATPRTLLSVYAPNQQRLQFSPDGGALMFLRGAEPKFNAYIMDELMLLDLKSGQARSLSAGLDRAVFSPRFLADGSGLEFTVEDDGYQYPARVPSAGGAIQPLGKNMVITDLDTAGGHTAVVASDDRSPPEVYALEDARLRALGAHNESLFRELELGAVEDIRFKSGAGTEVHGMLVKPAGYVQGRRYPTIVWIHGGPNGQDDHSLPLAAYSPQLERQLFASHGYLLLAINYRGGTGRGAAYARSILADWGHKEVEDLRAGVDWAIREGLADPARLGVGGWSYGGILTDYLIASDTRFKAAISGAGSANQLTTYGIDEYVVEYDAELGAPWRNPALWMKVSYPFFHADRIRTPTLFLGGDADFNVPIAGGEQMYQALRTLGVPTQLIVYPGEHHELVRPSFLVDRARRYLEWMDRYLRERP
jgi:dipeptidyl aminopeptidase/acylaminoacyl peptidase